MPRGYNTIIESLGVYLPPNVVTTAAGEIFRIVWLSWSLT